MVPQTLATVPSVLVAIACTVLAGCRSTDWPTYRHDDIREGAQPVSSALSDPARVRHLAVHWTFPATGRDSGAFASPIVVDGRVFVGSTSGHFYALDAATGAMLWQFPSPTAPPLVGSCGFGNYGVKSSAAYFKGTVIFGAPDPTAEAHLGSARLYALNAGNGALVWASDVVAHITGCTPDSTSELHERIAYSAPLVSGGNVYIGVADNGDNPIQNGMVRAVDVGTGHLVSGFAFASTSARGGGVWNGPASDRRGVYFTTGNTRSDTVGIQSPEPSINRGLSMLRVNPVTGAVIWQFQPVPYALDDDPDWSAGVAIMSTSCGAIAASVQKDGWAYALDTATGQCRWQFPPTAPTSPPSQACKFPPGGPHDHGDTDYKRPAATWGDVLIINSGGEALIDTTLGVTAGYGRLHALNACAPDEAHRVRWIADIPNASKGGYSIGAPTVTGGIVYVTTDQGHVVALADPSIVPPPGYRCSHVAFSAATCPPWYSVVPAPAVLADVALPDAGDASGLRNEASLSEGRLFVGTGGGHVYMLSSREGAPPCSPTNACGGCSTLFATPHSGCLDQASGKCGRYTCVGTDAVTCDTSTGLQNECGGCGLLSLPGTGHGRGDSCICPNAAEEEGTLVCSRDKNHLICCPCSSAPGCGPGAP